MTMREQAWNVPKLTVWQQNHDVLVGQWFVADRFGAFYFAGCWFRQMRAQIGIKHNRSPKRLDYRPIFIFKFMYDLIISCTILDQVKSNEIDEEIEAFSRFLSFLASMTCFCRIATSQLYTLSYVVPMFDSISKGPRGWINTRTWLVTCIFAERSQLLTETYLQHLKCD